MAFDGIVIKAISYELQQLSGARIDKIYQPNITSDYEMIVKVLSKTKLNSVFLYFLSEYNIKYNGGNKLVYIGMMLSKQSRNAIETALSIYEKSGNCLNQFMACLAILYENNRDYYNIYYNRFNSIYQNILKFHFDNNVNLSKEEVSEYMKLYLSMYFIGREKTLKFSIDLFSIEEIYLLINSLEGIGDYQNIIKICNEILNNKTDEDYIKLAVNKLIISLFVTKKYSEVLYNCLKYKDYMIKDSINKFVSYINPQTEEDKSVHNILLNIEGN